MSDGIKAMHDDADELHWAMKFLKVKTLVTVELYSPEASIYIEAARRAHNRIDSEELNPEKPKAQKIIAGELDQAQIQLDELNALKTKRQVELNALKTKALAKLTDRERAALGFPPQDAIDDEPIRKASRSSR